MSQMMFRQPGAIIWLCGPSGVGKSHLLMDCLRSTFDTRSKWGVGIVPAVRVRATLSDRNKFNPKDLALRLNLGLSDPNPVWAADGSNPFARATDGLHQQEISDASAQWCDTRSAKPEHALRVAFERSAVPRGVSVIAIEEAASLTKVHLHQSSRNYMTSLMQMNEEIGSTLLMCGTQEMEPLWLGNREVLNRSSWVWFHPYERDHGSDLRGYVELIKALSKRHFSGSEQCVLDNRDLVALNGGGVFGTTMAYLKRADAIRTMQGDSSLSRNILQAASASLEEHTDLSVYLADFHRVANPIPNLSWDDAEKSFAKSTRPTS